MASDAVPSPSVPPTLSVASASPGSSGGGTAAGASVHLEITGGKYPGTYDFSAKNGCATLGAGAGWAISYDDPAQKPTSVDLEAGTDLDSLAVGFGAGEGYFATHVESHIGQANGATTLAVTADAIDLASQGGDGTTAKIDLHADCGGTGQPPAAFVAPTPHLQGTPAPGSTVFHIVVGFGPKAGTYDTWTMRATCGADDTTFAASFTDPEAIPAMAMVAGAIGDASAPPDGGLTLLFGSGIDLVIYATSPSAAIAGIPVARSTCPTTRQRPAPSTDRRRRGR